MQEHLERSPYLPEPLTTSSDSSPLPDINPYAPTLVLDESGTILHTTHAARHLLGYPLDQALDPYFFTHIHDHNVQPVMRDMAAMVCHGKTKARWMLRLRTGRGRWQWYQALARSQSLPLSTRIIVTLRHAQER